MNLIKKIGLMVRDARKRATMTQGELGSVIGVSAPALCELEGGSRKSVPAPDEMVRIHDALHDVKLLQEYCDCCPVRKRIIIRKFKPLNNILAGSHASVMKVICKQAEASEALSIMVPKMLRKGFADDPDFREYRNEAIIKIIDMKRGMEILLDQMLEDRVLSPDELRWLMEMQQQRCVENGHHVPDGSEA